MNRQELNKHLVEVGKCILESGSKVENLPESVKEDLKDLDMVVTYLQCGLHVPDNLEKAYERLLRTAQVEEKGGVQVVKAFDEPSKVAFLSVIGGIVEEGPEGMPEGMPEAVEVLKKDIEAWEDGPLILSGNSLLLFTQIAMAIVEIGKQEK